MLVLVLTLVAVAHTDGVATDVTEARPSLELEMATVAVPLNPLQSEPRAAPDAACGDHEERHVRIEKTTFTTALPLSAESASLRTNLVKLASSTFGLKLDAASSVAEPPGTLVIATLRF